MGTANPRDGADCEGKEANSELYLQGLRFWWDIQVGLSVGGSGLGWPA